MHLMIDEYVCQKYHKVTFFRGELWPASCLSPSPCASPDEECLSLLLPLCSPPPPPPPALPLPSHPLHGYPLACLERPWPDPAASPPYSPSPSEPPSSPFVHVVRLPCEPTHENETISIILCSSSHNHFIIIHKYTSTSYNHNIIRTRMSYYRYQPFCYTHTNIILSIYIMSN